MLGSVGAHRRSPALGLEEPNQRQDRTECCDRAAHRTDSLRPTSGSLGVHSRQLIETGPQRIPGREPHDPDVSGDDGGYAQKTGFERCPDGVKVIITDGQLGENIDLRVRQVVPVQPAGWSARVDCPVAALAHYETGPVGQNCADSDVPKYVGPPCLGKGTLPGCIQVAETLHSNIVDQVRTAPCSRASAAALCSASFLDRPVPSPTMAPSTSTLAVKVLS